ncbi:MAG: glycosyltransferase [Anaerolineae bacterium]|jgi:cellulose synthase/poly-beta-1,6-N-acetylglucosamine synthase-like glycosyltransferase
MPVVELLYALSILALSFYGFNNLLLAWIYLRRARTPVRERTPLREPWPRVTVQLPIYNELHTAERLLAAVAGLDYPRDRLEIQVLDDSTDATRRLVAKAVMRLQAEGVDAVHLMREDRVGFKAGALAAGLAQARGEFVAIFDADFVPNSDFLQRLVPHFADPAVGCIQARWGHVNRDYSTLTQLQALGVDGHFVVQQTARSRAGLFLNFNGTAGIWRRTCIEDAGGWQGDTLTEDLDLSYRAQLRGWRIVYRPDVVVPAELPAQIGAFKRQQARWAQGSIETALKLMGRLLRSGQRPAVKLEGVMHLTGYLVHPLMLSVILLTLPMSFSHSWVLLSIPWLMISAAGPPFLYIVAQLADRGEGRRRLRYMPLLIMLGMGLCLNNTAAVLRGLLGIRRDFQRTPKFDLRHAADSWLGSVYALGGDWMVWPELALAGVVLVFLALHRVRWTFVPWLLLYAGGFAYVAGVNLFQTYRRRRFLQAAQMSSK